MDLKLAGSLTSIPTFLSSGETRASFNCARNKPWLNDILAFSLLWSHDQRCENALTSLQYGRWQEVPWATICNWLAWCWAVSSLHQLWPEWTLWAEVHRAHHNRQIGCESNQQDGSWLQQWWWTSDEKRKSITPTSTVSMCPVMKREGKEPQHQGVMRPVTRREGIEP